MPSTAGRREPGSERAAAAAALHAQAAAAARRRAPSAASGSAQGGRQAGAVAGSRAGVPGFDPVASEPPGRADGLVLSWQAPERCTRCEVWARRDPGAQDLRDPETAAADGGRHCLSAGHASAADPVQHQLALAHGADTSRLTIFEHHGRAHAQHAHEQGSVNPEQPGRPDAGDALAVVNRTGVIDNTSDDGWTWLGTAHAPHFWIAGTVLTCGDLGVELAVQACDGAGCALPLSACPRVRAPAH